MPLALLLGAGFSKWAANLPVASQLFDFDVRPFGPQERRKLAAVRALKEHWDTTHPADQAERFVAYALAAGGDYRDLVLWYVQRRLVAPFIWEERTRRHVLQVDERRADSLPGVQRARDFLGRCNPDGIVSLNYDMLPEYAPGTRRFHFGRHGEVLLGRGPYPVSRWSRPVALTGAIRYAKLHGSVSWDVDGRYVDGRCGLTGRALIVAPLPEKTPPPALADVWALARTILVGATRIIAFGIAFNPYDEAVLALFRERAGTPLESVLLIDPAPKVAEAQALWPSAEIVTAAPPPDGDDVIRTWLRRG